MPPSGHPKSAESGENTTFANLVLDGNLLAKRTFRKEANDKARRCSAAARLTAATHTSADPQGVALRPFDPPNGDGRLSISGLWGRRGL